MAYNHFAGHAITIRSRGGAPLVVPVSGSVIIPDVFIVEPTVDFGNVYMGNFGRKRLTLTNRAPIQTEVSLDLTDFSQFYVAPPQLFDPAGDDDMSIGDMSMFQVESVGAFLPPPHMQSALLPRRAPAPCHMPMVPTLSSCCRLPPVHRPVAVGRLLAVAVAPLCSFAAHRDAGQFKLWGALS